MISSAEISSCLLHRTNLRRVWDETLPRLVAVGLNPSRADAERNDPTILTLIHFAKFWGFGGLQMENLYSFRSSSPAEMMTSAARCSPLNRQAIKAAIEYAGATSRRILACWGNDGSFEDEDEWFKARSLSQGVSLVCLGRTMIGAPKHPMARGKHRVDRSQQPVIWRGCL